MLRIFFILLLLTSCKTAANSTVSASIKITEDETLDLTKYSANETDYKKLRAELGDQYEKTMQHLQSSLSQPAQGIPADFNSCSVPQENRVQGVIRTHTAECQAGHTRCTSATTNRASFSAEAASSSP